MTDTQWQSPFLWMVDSYQEFSVRDGFDGSFLQQRSLSVAWRRFYSLWQLWWASSAVRMLPRMLRLYAYIKTIESNLVGSTCDSVFKYLESSTISCTLNFFFRNILHFFYMCFPYLDFWIITGQEIAVRQLQICKFAVIIFLAAHWVMFNCRFY